VDQFRLVLSALKQLSGVSIVSNPKVIVANEQPATIHIGQRERPFLSVVTPATQTTAPVVTYNPGEPVDFGVKLTVTPTINTVSNITVKIEPELTRFIGDKTAPNGQSYPVIATKKIQTIFCLENGRTVAIGGLTETTDKDVTKKIPLLGDIPLIGKFLFSNSHMEKQQTKTIIFVTLGIASPSAMKSNEGIPDNSELVHRKLLQDSPKRKKMEKDIEDIVNKLEAEQKNFPAPEPAMAGNK
jgi:type II secretory pathway component GspD/PulD (secretin)